ncbi:hypothetical protein QBC41DRAFT_58151 [Cercophora samala]|uniref:Uncharacterized protein n=1 Tax=Cercophora samala TaxID=330535 RepID=A0AA39ZHR5_9PEZI|nr:hypothetical protein QBC41DRAFT_58151 [Cercophora samala]
MYYLFRRRTSTLLIDHLFNPRISLTSTSARVNKSFGSIVILSVSIFLLLLLVGCLLERRDGVNSHRGWGSAVLLFFWLPTVLCFVSWLFCFGLEFLVLSTQLTGFVVFGSRLLLQNYES